ncbi:mitochondrial carrier domain-containing protein [Cladochytrium replicatum]|nr:mitochondrial carrier domain-containing protein [Cladochytrium replicatum]
MSDNVAHALAGAAGGMVSMALTYPLTTVSVRHQVQKSTVSKDAYKSQLDAFRKIIKEEGVQGFYSGINSALFGIAVTQGIYYYFYEKVKGIFEEAAEGRKNMTVVESMSAGALAGAATAIMTNPIWVVNTRQTVKKQPADEDAKPGPTAAQKLGFFQTALKIVKEDGVQGLFQGIVPALILVINPIIQYTVFEQLKAVMSKSKKALSSFDFFLLGAVSKLAATGITYPYIVVKSRMQLKQSASSEARYNSVMDGLNKILKNEGVKGLYKGIETKLLQSVLTSAFTFAFKEFFFEKAVLALVFLRLREGAPTASS